MYIQLNVGSVWLAASALVLSLCPVLGSSAYANPNPDSESEAKPPPARGNDGGDSAAPSPAVRGGGADVGEVIEIHGQAPDSDGVHANAARALDETAFVTVVHVDDYEGQTTSVAELVSESVGVRARSMGGLGSFSSISVRGADAGHTAVFVDGIPLSRLASVSVDLSRFDVSSVSALELYRGTVPTSFGSVTIGGALNLVTQTGVPASGHSLSLSLGGGSFGARHARARWLGDSADQQREYHVSASYAGARGDFVYFDDRGTSLDQGDDQMVQRRNNHYDEVHAVARMRGRDAGLTYRAGLRGAWKRQGVPGDTHAQSERASLSSFTSIADAGIDTDRLWGQGQLSGTAHVYGIFEWQRYRDLEGEISIGAQDRRYLNGSAGMGIRVRRGFAASHRLELGAEGRMDAFEDRDMIGVGDEMTRSRGRRSELAITAEHVWSPAIGVQVQPAVRFDWLRTVPVIDRRRPTADVDGIRNDLVASPRLSARVRLADAWAIKASAGRYMRAPTLIELFGDRGFTVGNPALRSETGLSGDIGVVLAPLGRKAAGGARDSDGFAIDAMVDRLFGEMVLFARDARDTIVFASGGGPAATALNLGDSRTYGMESGMSVRVAKAVTLSGNYTYLVARQRSPLVSYDQKPLPQRPRHQLYGRVVISERAWGREFRVWADGQFSATSYLDAAGLAPVPSRTLIGAGVRAALFGNVSLSAEVKNLANSRIEYLELDPPPQPGLDTMP